MEHTPINDSAADPAKTKKSNKRNKSKTKNGNGGKMVDQPISDTGNSIANGDPKANGGNENHQESLSNDSGALETIEAVQVSGTSNHAEEQLKNERLKTATLQEELQALTSTHRLDISEYSTKLQSEISRTQKLEIELTKLRNEIDKEKDERQKERDLANARIGELELDVREGTEQHNALKERVRTMTATVGERMRADAEELAQSKQTIEDLEEQNGMLNDNLEQLKEQISNLDAQNKKVSQELLTLRNNLNQAQHNWNKEREDLLIAKQDIREQYQATKQAMQDWEVIAIEERSVRESLEDRVVELEDQLLSQKEIHEVVVSDRDRATSTIDGLQRAVQEIQDARKKELREVVENTQAQIKELTALSHDLELRAAEAENNLIAAQQHLERVIPFEKEVKEKNLLIGKLRHEAVTLNDHLRKALRMLKRDNADDKIDKQLVTNVFLQFVSIQRGDTKKYEVLQLIASVLDWNDEQREKAGLLRPGASNSGTSSFMSSLKTPSFHRSPSSPALGDAYDGSKDACFPMKAIWSSVLDAEN
ncbi:hypothetical protein EDC01DRAFT_719446 [Geopyxis carbonaria]|nr:hypothetical protein EDC01DRAFT_719446 [Geopyxis carbonaria]